MENQLVDSLMQKHPIIKRHEALLAKIHYPWLLKKHGGLCERVLTPHTPPPITVCLCLVIGFSNHQSPRNAINKVVLPFEKHNTQFAADRTWLSLQFLQMSRKLSQDQANGKNWQATSSLSSHSKQSELQLETHSMMESLIGNL
ncbi:hypothetical protein VNO77_03871 [Canavalia gladiata]|uniref:Uncharacterized protein n=1 Tax=Canavalia gladiata TaxID=3824 RepID=A0AAN9R779_CANGL